MKRFIILALIAILIGILTMSCEKETIREIAGPVEYDTIVQYDTTATIDTSIQYDTTAVIDTIVVIDTIIQYDTTIIVQHDTTIIIQHDTTIIVQHDTTATIDALDYYHALQLEINSILVPQGLDSYYPTINTYDIEIIVNNSTQMEIQMWWIAWNFTTGEVWGIWGIFIVTYNGPNNWTIEDITPMLSTANISITKQLPLRTLR